MQLTLKPGQDATRPCAKLDHEVVGFSVYNLPGTKENTLVIQTETLGLLRTDKRLGSDDVIYSSGKFDFTPTNGICTAADLLPATVTLAPGAPSTLPDGGTDPGKPGQDITYKWSNVRIGATTQVPGTQFAADLAYTENGCTANYDGIGLYPVISCADASGAPDESLCQTSALPDGGTAPACNLDTGECMNPDFAAKCDTVSLFCVPSKPIPSLK